MDQYQKLRKEVAAFGALSRLLGESVGAKTYDDLKREHAIMFAGIEKMIGKLEIASELKQVAAPTRLKASEVEALWMRTPYYMKPQAFAAAVQDAAGVP